jgi:hypothetical protein
MIDYLLQVAPLMLALILENGYIAAILPIEETTCGWDGYLGHVNSSREHARVFKGEV